MENIIIISQSIVAFFIVNQYTDEVVALVSAFFAGLLGYLGKKVGQVLWKRFKTRRELRQHGYNGGTKK